MSNDNAQFDSTSNHDNTNTPQDTQAYTQDVTQQSQTSSGQGDAAQASGQYASTPEAGAAYGQYAQNDTGLNQYGYPQAQQNQQYTQGGYGQHDSQQGQYGQNSYAHQGQYGQGSSAQQGYQGQYGQYTQGYDQNAYGQGQYGGPQSYAQPLAAPAASYGSRVGAYLLDGLLSTIPMIILGGLGLWLALKDAYEVPSNDPFHPDETTLDGINGSGFAIAGLGLLASLLFQVWNRGVRQGKTGQSLGKKMLHISVLDERTGRPAGAGAGAGRFGVEFGFGIVNMIAQVLSILDLLWPLWDNKKQTLHDKVVHTVVVQGDPQV